MRQGKSTYINGRTIDRGGFYSLLFLYIIGYIERIKNYNEQIKRTKIRKNIEKVLDMCYKNNKLKIV